MRPSLGIDVAAPAEVAWAELVELDAWPHWGPSIRSARLGGAGGRGGGPGRGPAVGPEPPPRPPRRRRPSPERWRHRRRPDRGRRPATFPGRRVDRRGAPSLLVVVGLRRARHRALRHD